MMNIHCQLVTATSHPDSADSHSTVIGLPRISTVSARPRSRLVNQCVRNTNIAGRIAASTTPSRNRSTISAGTHGSTPCSEAKIPQPIRHQKISRLTLPRSA
jgi:hypothetical protein